MIKPLHWYFKTSLVLRILAGFGLGSIIGGVLWFISSRSGMPIATNLAPYIMPFGSIFINMLKMIVIPIIFFSLIVGSASLPIKKFGRVGLKVIGWYLLTSLAAAVLGAVLALEINPGAGADLSGWEQLVQALGTQASAIDTEKVKAGSLVSLFLNLFQNPFEALANNNYLPIIVFAILFGLAVRVSIEAARDRLDSERLERLIDLITAARDAVFKVVDWILEYAPVGVLALSIINFGLYGPKIVGPYIRVVLGVIFGILLMIFGVYSLMMILVIRKNPIKLFKNIQKAMVTAFITRSSAATLPVSIKTASQELKIRDELASFSLPLGATINMDGVCVHLPMFAVLAVNIFGLDLNLHTLFIMVITTVLAAIGAGGVPGGSLMLLFIILEAIGLNSQQVAVVVALALGVNPILDMFETMNNVTGDLVCTYVVASKEDLIVKPEMEKA